MFLTPRFVPKTIEELKAKGPDNAELAKQEAKLKQQVLAGRIHELGEVAERQVRNELCMLCTRIIIDRWASRPLFANIHMWQLRCTCICGAISSSPYTALSAPLPACDEAYT